MSQSARTEIKPAVAAITVALSVFVGTMEIFVAVLAFAVAGRQHHPHGGISWSNGTAASVAYGVAAASILNCLLAYGKARLHPVITIFTTAVFIITVLLVNVLFVRAW